MSGWTAENTARAVESQRSELWCPVFARVVGAYNPDSRPEGPQREEYIRNHKLMENGFYNVLRCSTPLVPPATQ
jgi:hypothetical protein